MRYAAQTTVAPERSRAEIERICSRYGAREFAYGWQDGQALVGFACDTPVGPRKVRFVLPLPAPEDAARTPSGRRRHGEAAKGRAHEQEMRRRWRALALAIKAKLETVASNIATFEAEFLSYLVLPGGQTVGERLQSGLHRALESGKLPPLLPMSAEEK